jgi:cardiolipin synthase
MLTAGIVVLAIVVVLLVLNLTTGGKKVKEELTHLYSVDDPQFVRTIGTLLGPAVLPGNRVDAFYNGDQIFPAMLGAIRSAQRSVTFETYIYWSGEIGREFADALADRARAGIKVHVLIDAVGAASIDGEALDVMKLAGVEIAPFRPVRWYTLGKLNNRTHRKLLVIDGRIGFTGGVGIADLWRGDAQDPDHWRDSHFRLQGPAVGQMQGAFMDHWIATRSVVLHGDDYFPPLESVGEQQAQTFRSGADEGVESVRLMYLLSLTAATRSIRIANAYFVPDDLTVETLVAARERGVTVEVLVPGRHSDSKLVRNAARARWGRLLEAGVQIYEYLPTMYHCKVMIVDDCWTSVGSTNFDNRSFRLNEEANLNILDGDFAQAESRQFAADLTRAKQTTLEEWQRRPLREKMMEHLSALLRSQL